MVDLVADERIAAQMKLDAELSSMRPGRGFGFRPSLMSSDATAFRTKDTFMADARDAARSNPYGRSATRSTVDAVIGLNFKLNYMPNAEALGVTPEEALAYASMVENVWEVASTSPWFPMDA